MASTAGQGDQPLDDLEQGRDSHAEAPTPQSEEEDNANATGQRIKPLDLLPHPKSRSHLEVEKVIVLSFRSLQLQRIAELQDEVLKLALRAAAGKALPDQNKKVDDALENYAKALRNYETLSLNALPEVPRGATLVGSVLSTENEEPSRSAIIKIGTRLINRIADAPRLKSFLQPLRNILIILDPLIASNSVFAWYAVKYVLARFEPSEPVPSDLLQAMQGILGNLGFRELDSLGRQRRSEETALTERLVMAMFGGVALIAPMLIMTLHPSRNVSLITTSLATFIFALFLAVGATNSAGKDVLAATAAYAAVLVVFVGTNTTGPS